MSGIERRRLFVGKQQKQQRLTEKRERKKRRMRRNNNNNNKRGISSRKDANGSRDNERVNHKWHQPVLSDALLILSHSAMKPVPSRGNKVNGRTNYTYTVADNSRLLLF